MDKRTRPSLWRGEYNINILTLDNQHQRLFMMLKQLDDAIALGQAAFTVMPLWQALRGYAEHHFTYEEQLMNQSHYPELQNHRALHLRLLQQLDKLQLSYEGSSLGIGAQLSDHFGHWLLDHIAAEDKKLGQFLVSLYGADRH